MLGSLTACGGAADSQSGQDQSASKQEGSQNQESQDNDSQKDDAAAKDDQELMTVHLLAKKDVDYAAGLKGDISKIEEEPKFQYVQERLAEYGVKLEVEAVANEQFETVTTTRLASGNDLMDFFNAVGLGSADLVSYGESSVIADINEALAQYDEDGSVKAAWTKYFPDFEGKYTTEDGKLYWLPYMVRKVLTGTEMENLGSPRSLSIRKDWLDKIGVDYKIEWTPEELKEVLVRFREEDANGNGVADEVVALDISQWCSGIAQGFGIGYTFESQFVSYNTTTGEILNPWDSKEELAAYVTFMRELGDAGLLDSSMIGDSNYGEASLKLLAENRAVLISEYSGEEWLEPQIPVENAEFAPIMVKTAYAPLQTLEGMNTAYGMKFVINAKGNVEAVVRMLDCIYSDDMIHFLSYGFCEDYGTATKDHVHNEDGTIANITRTDEEIQSGTSGWSAPMEQMLWDTLPRVAYVTMSYEDKLKERSHEAKNEFMKFLYENPDAYEINECDYGTAMSTSEELSVAEELETTLQTYSSEAITNLILGDYSLDDLDKYIDEMKNLGMDDYVNVFKAKRERYDALVK